MPTPHPKTTNLLFNEDRLWVRRQPDGAVDPLWSDAGPLVCDAIAELAGTLGDRAVRAVDHTGIAPPDSAEPLGLRDLFDIVAPELYHVAGSGQQLLHWRRTHRFCGGCGHPMVRHATERAMQCPACKHLAYPRINPVVITRVTRGREILLARRATGLTSFYSVVAGFVEAGETLEQAVAREIHEEVGLCVRDIRYFASQPWSFPNNLMIAFTAEWAAGEVRPDGVEIAEAGWFAPERLPPIPHPISISRRLIDAHVAVVGQ